MIHVTRQFIKDVDDLAVALRGVFINEARRDGHDVVGEVRCTILDPKDPAQSNEHLLPEELQSPENMVYVRMVAEAVPLPLATGGVITKEQAPTVGERP